VIAVSGCSTCSTAPPAAEGCGMAFRKPQQHFEAASAAQGRRTAGPPAQPTPAGIWLQSPQAMRRLYFNHSGNAHRLASGTTDASRHTAPATTGDATLVPDSERQPPSMRLPITSLPYATTSGCVCTQSTLIGDVVMTNRLQRGCPSRPCHMPPRWEKNAALSSGTAHSSGTAQAWSAGSCVS